MTSQGMLHPVGLRTNFHVIYSSKPYNEWLRTYGPKCEKTKIGHSWRGALYIPSGSNCGSDLVHRAGQPFLDNHYIVVINTMSVQAPSNLNL